MAPRIGIVYGSASDEAVMKETAAVLEQFGVEYELQVMSAHRTPATVVAYAQAAAGRGLKVLIAGAGLAAHLAGAVAANTILPVIGVPLDRQARREKRRLAGAADSGAAGCGAGRRVAHAEKFLTARLLSRIRRRDHLPDLSECCAWLRQPATFLYSNAARRRVYLMCC
jgi:hypothetical protein